MASGSDQERTEEATPRRKQEAADEGRIPRSVELGTAALMIGGAISVSMVFPAVGSKAIAVFGDGLRRIGETGESANIMQLKHAGFATLAMVGLAGSALGGTALAVGALQARGTFATAPLSPKWSQLNPLSNAQRIIGWRAVADLLKALLKVCIIGFITWRVMGAGWHDLLDLGGRDAASVLATVRHYGAKLLTTVGLSYLALAAADYAFQWWQHVKSMRMTKDEVRQESKQQDGDPALKSRIRAIARARIRRQMFADVPKADVVIVNPTHIAIALRYDPLTAPAPVVLAMGERKVAERIKKLAREHGVPTLENKPLARALLRTARVGMTIPAELYAAVAEVLAFVFRQRVLRGDGPQWSGTITR